jgi:hypothetical protein
MMTMNTVIGLYQRPAPKKQVSRLQQEAARIAAGLPPQLAVTLPPGDAATYNSTESAITHVHPEQGEPEPMAAATADPSVQARAAVDTLLEAVAVAETGEQVKALVNDLGNGNNGNGKKRGRPRKYKYTSEAERKRVYRAAAQLESERYLREYHLTPDSPIPDELRQAYSLNVATFGELLKTKDIRDAVFRGLLQDYRRTVLGIGVPANRAVYPKAPSYMSEAPKGMGKLITGGFGHEKIAKDIGHSQQTFAQLSKPTLEHDPLAVSQFSSMPVTDRQHTQKSSNYEDVEHVDGQTDSSGTEVTFAKNIRWPASWFQAKFKRPYAEVAQECLKRCAELLSDEIKQEDGYTEEQGHETDGAVHHAGFVNFCSICKHRLGPWVTPEHFVERHLEYVQLLFARAKVTFRRKFFDEFRTNP